MKWFARIGICAGAQALAVSGCSPDFDPPSRVTSFRVLAVGADTPYAAPGATVNLDTLSFDPEGRAIDWGWGTCVDPVSSQVTDCIDGVDWSSFVVTSSATRAVTLPADVITRLPVAAQPRASVGVVAVGCPGELSVPSNPRSIASTGALPFLCRDRTTGRVLADDEYVAGVKRIFARATDRNANPVIAQVTWDGQPWAEDEVKTATPCDTTGNDIGACTGAVRHDVAVSLTPASFESGVDSFGTPFTEALVVQYYATEGIFSDDSRIASDAATHWAARSAPDGKGEAQTITMWMVARDDRGGVTWTTRTVSVAAAGHS
jgi:hypothetical protein